VAIQLNDTHPAIAIAELMRVLIDIHAVPWNEAWAQTIGAFGYTNHTLMPEALERWPVALFERLLPRHLEIIYEINRRFLRHVMDAFPYDVDRVSRMSIIEEGRERQVRMAHLAVVGSRSVNGVAKIHTRLLRQELLRDFHELYPERFSNKTNGVTPRRWLLACNPRLAELITSRIGSGWVTHFDELAGLEAHAGDLEFLAQIRAVKQANKDALAALIRTELALEVNPASIFDCQIKRLHEYKRQLLNAIHVVALYLRVKRGEPIVPRTFIFGAKAAPGYRQAKLIIKFIHAIAYVINEDPGNKDLRVAYLPNYRVSLAEKIIPAADVSEQISTAGMEASGTGNMKLAMNGALTVGTLDGANIEIREAVGDDNFFLFGLTAEEVLKQKAAGISGRVAYEADAELKQAIDLIRSGFFCPEDRALFHPLIDPLLERDPYLVLSDFSAYAACQRAVGAAYLDLDGWSRKALLNIARVGIFSSDRTVAEYAQEIWRIEPVEIVLDAYTGAPF
jgi:starch phosphorylase